MDIKEKFKIFIDKQKNSKRSVTPNIPFANEHINYSDFNNQIAVTTSVTRKSSILDEYSLPHEAEMAVIQSVNPVYFEENSINVSEFELKKFPLTIDIHVIGGTRSRLRKQQVVISRKVSRLITEKQEECSKEMEKVKELQQELCLSIVLCQESRSYLNVGKKLFTVAALKILADYNKRKKIEEVIELMKTIRTLEMADIQLQKLLRAEDYPGAIQLLLEYQQVAETFKHFICISELSKKLADTLETTQDRLNNAVGKLAINFNEESYHKLYLAYALLGKIQVMMDQLHMHLTFHVHNNFLNIVLGYVQLCSISDKTENAYDDKFSNMQYAEICKCVNDDYFLPCFLDLSRSVWNILKNYKSIIKWHKINTINIEFDLIEDTVKYILQQLEHGLVRLWQDVQAKLKIFILANDLSNFKFDDFLKILNILDKLIAIGEDFCGSNSETLRESIKTQSYNYFKRHHQFKMEELHMFLENEIWELCPVKPNFSIYKLHEYKFLQEDNDLATPFGSPVKINDTAAHLRSHYTFSDDENPFTLSLDDSLEEDILISNEDVPSSDEEDLPLDAELDSPNKSVSIYNKETLEAPIVTNTTLTILRLFGKYLQMMFLLQPIAFDVMVCLSQLFDYYEYAVFILFGMRSEIDQNISWQLQAQLRRTQEMLVINVDSVEDSKLASNKVPKPSLSSLVKLDSAENVFGLPTRIVAVESLAFLAKQLEDLQPHIEGFLLQSQKSFLQKFYSGAVKTIPEVRHHIYTVVAFDVIDYNGLMNEILLVKWDINDLMSEHNKYVNTLLRQLQVLSVRLQNIYINNHPLPKYIQCSLWEGVIKLVFSTLLEGYANIRKCSNEGRSLMQLDYQQLLMTLDTLSPVLSKVDRQLVDNYIKAYYLPESELEKWVEQNLHNYSVRQMISLTSLMGHIGKRARQRISLFLEKEKKLSS